jgi:hypothetical protein
VRLAVKNNFAICDLSVLWYVFEFNKETFVCSGNAADALEEATCLITKSYFSKGLKVWILHKGHVLHLLASYCMYYCVGEILLGPMIGAQCNGHVGGFHVP